MQQFNSTNLEASFIKGLLRNIHLPALPTAGNGDYLVQGVDYTYGNSVIHCTSSGIITSDGMSYGGMVFVPRVNNIRKLAPAVGGDGCVCSETFICGQGVPQAEYKVVASFSTDKLIPGITSPYISSSTYYDVDTHKRLGQYLRWYRDTKGIDLMGLYNCFTGETTPFGHIKNGTLREGEGTNTRAWIVPAHLNKSYTIYVNSCYDVSIKGVFLNEFGRITYRDYEGKKFVDDMLDSDLETYNHTSYSKPLLYNTSTQDKDVLIYDNNFYILIQTDITHKEPIVVLEGDYTSAKSRVITGAEYREDINYSMATPALKPSLGAYAGIKITPYSPRLIEFLLEHPITSDEDIPLNIARVRGVLNGSASDNPLADVWSDYLRYALYNQYFTYSSDYYFKKKNPTTELIREKNIPQSMLVYEKDKDGNPTGKIVGLKNCNPSRKFDTQYDITGYVDKDMENLLFGYRSIK